MCQFDFKGLTKEERIAIRRKKAQLRMEMRRQEEIAAAKELKRLDDIRIPIANETTFLIVPPSENKVVAEVRFPTSLTYSQQYDLAAVHTDMTTARSTLLHQISLMKGHFTSHGSKFSHDAYYRVYVVTLRAEGKAFLMPKELCSFTRKLTRGSMWAIPKAWAIPAWHNNTPLRMSPFGTAVSTAYGDGTLLGRGDILYDTCKLKVSFGIIFVSPTRIHPRVLTTGFSASPLLTKTKSSSTTPVLKKHILTTKHGKLSHGMLVSSAYGRGQLIGRGYIAYETYEVRLSFGTMYVVPSHLRPAPTTTSATTSRRPQSNNRTSTTSSVPVPKHMSIDARIDEILASASDNDDITDDEKKADATPERQSRPRKPSNRPPVSRRDSSNSSTRRKKAEWPLTIQSAPPTGLLELNNSFSGSRTCASYGYEFEQASYGQPKVLSVQSFLHKDCLPKDSNDIPNLIKVWSVCTELDKKPRRKDEDSNDTKKDWLVIGCLVDNRKTKKTMKILLLDMHDVHTGTIDLAKSNVRETSRSKPLEIQSTYCEKVCTKTKERIRNELFVPYIKAGLKFQKNTAVDKKSRVHDPHQESRKDQPSADQVDIKRVHKANSTAKNRSTRSSRNRKQTKFFTPNADSTDNDKGIISCMATYSSRN